MNIVDHILRYAGIKSDISSRDELEDTFISSCDFDMWPTANVIGGAKTEYLKAYSHPDKFGFAQELNLDTKFHIKDYFYTLSEKFSFDDTLEIHLESLIRQGNEPKEKDNFTYSLIRKHINFLKNCIKKLKIAPEDAFITIDAHSGLVNDIMTRGGYLWATQGFRFKSDTELNKARDHFKEFAKKSGIDIKDNDLKYFKYPCHFAAFAVKSAQGIQEIGKNFLLQYSWLGVMSGSDDEQSEPLRYQKAYYESGKDEAIRTLSKGFLAVMNKYNYRNEENTIAAFLKKNKIFSRFMK